MRITEQMEFSVGTGRLVALTPKGKAAVDRAVVDHLANEQRLLEALSAGERRTLSGLLRKLLASEVFAALDPAKSHAGASR